jgi:outer membrane receptor protein involved in Fe transport
MRILQTSKALTLTASALTMALALAPPAYAQEAASEQDAPETLQSEVEVESGEDATTSEAIVVTGSRIRRPNLESSVPITSIGGEEFIQQGDTNVGDALNELPQLSSTFSQQNPGLGVGIAGLNLLDLRGLAPQRTLVLVNGRRHVGSDITNAAVNVDINTIPNDLIERVDIVTGAQSSVYGSDAIAGVVNFVLRKDFEGLQLRGNASIAEEGYGAEQYVSAMYGLGFGGGRGNVTRLRHPALSQCQRPRRRRRGSGGQRRDSRSRVHAGYTQRHQQPIRPRPGHPSGRRQRALRHKQQRADQSHPQRYWRANGSGAVQLRLHLRTGRSFDAADRHSLRDDPQRPVRRRQRPDGT